MNNHTRAEELPQLTFEVAKKIREFPEFSMTVTSADVSAYYAATGLTAVAGSAIVPPGYAAVFGRLGYLRRHRMPGGGVLLRQEIQWLAPATVGEPMTIQAVVESAEEDPRGRRKIVFRTTAGQAGHPVAIVRITAGWPS